MDILLGALRLTLCRGFLQLVPRVNRTILRQPYTVTDLDSVGGDFSFATGVNAWGQLTGDSHTADDQMSVLVGNTSGDGFVDAGDPLQTRNRSGQGTAASNLRSEMNADGFVNSGDTTVVRRGQGRSCRNLLAVWQVLDGISVIFR